MIPRYEKKVKTKTGRDFRKKNLVTWYVPKQKIPVDSPFTYPADNGHPLPVSKPTTNSFTVNDWNEKWKLLRSQSPFISDTAKNHSRYSNAKQTNTDISNFPEFSSFSQIHKSIQNQIDFHDRMCDYMQYITSSNPNPADFSKLHQPSIFHSSLHPSVTINPTTFGEANKPTNIMDHNWRLSKVRHCINLMQTQLSKFQSDSKIPDSQTFNVRDISTPHIDDFIDQSQSQKLKKITTNFPLLLELFFRMDNESIHDFDRFIHGRMYHETDFTCSFYDVPIHRADPSTLSYSYIPGLSQYPLATDPQTGASTDDIKFDLSTIPELNGLIDIEQESKIDISVEDLLIDHEELYPESAIQRDFFNYYTSNIDLFILDSIVDLEHRFPNAHAKFASHLQSLKKFEQSEPSDQTDQSDCMSESPLLDYFKTAGSILEACDIWYQEFMDWRYSSEIFRPSTILIDNLTIVPSQMGDEPGKLSYRRIWPIPYSHSTLMASAPSNVPQLNMSNSLFSILHPDDFPLPYQHPPKITESEHKDSISKEKLAIQNSDTNNCLLITHLTSQVLFLPEHYGMTFDTLNQTASDLTRALLTDPTYTSKLGDSLDDSPGAVGAVGSGSGSGSVTPSRTFPGSEGSDSRPNAIFYRITDKKLLKKSKKCRNLYEYQQIHYSQRLSNINSNFHDYIKEPSIQEDTTRFHSNSFWSAFANENDSHSDEDGDFEEDEKFRSLLKNPDPSSILNEHATSLQNQSSRDDTDTNNDNILPMTLLLESLGAPIRPMVSATKLSTRDLLSAVPKKYYVPKGQYPAGVFHNRPKLQTGSVSDVPNTTISALISSIEYEKYFVGRVGRLSYHKALDQPFRINIQKSFLSPFVPVNLTESMVKVIFFHEHFNEIISSYFVLGSQTLQDIRDIFSCRSDEGEETMAAHDKRTPTRNAMFFIGDTIYLDKTVPRDSFVDYAEPILKWIQAGKKKAKKNLDHYKESVIRELSHLSHEDRLAQIEFRLKRFEAQGFSNRHLNLLKIRDPYSERERQPPEKVAPMSSVKISELNLELGRQYLFQHVGDCTHLVVFESLRSVNQFDILNYNAYPLEVDIARKRWKICVLCKVYPAKVLTYYDLALPDHPAPLCEKCYRLWYFTEKDPSSYDSTQIGNPSPDNLKIYKAHRMYPYIGG